MAAVCPQMTSGPKTAHTVLHGGLLQCDSPAQSARPACRDEQAGPKSASYCLVFSHKCPVSGWPPPHAPLSLLCSPVPRRKSLLMPPHHNPPSEFLSPPLYLFPHSLTFLPGGLPCRQGVWAAKPVLPHSMSKQVRGRPCGSCSRREQRSCPLHQRLAPKALPMFALDLREGPLGHTGMELDSSRAIRVCSESVGLKGLGKF